jgi:putative SOS response-associated peptidase YedK
LNFAVCCSLIESWRPTLGVVYVPGWVAYTLLTTEPNAVVAPVHAKATPVILTTEEERDV